MVTLPTKLLKLAVTLASSLIIAVTCNAQETTKALHGKLKSGQALSFAPDATEEARTIKAEWICEAARKQMKIEVTNAVIRDPLKLESATFENEVVLSHCDFKKAVDFSHVTAKQHVSFSGSIFEDGATFRGAVLQEDTMFDGAEFHAGKASFVDARVEGIFDATGARFLGGVGPDFSRAFFARTALFRKVEFDGDAIFHQTHFGGVTEFQGVIFKGKGDFSQAKFDVDASFGGESNEDDKTPAGRFEREADFSNAEFEASVDFEGVSFGGDADFSASEIKGVALFSSDQDRELPGAKFEGDADFSNAHFGSSAEFFGAVFMGKTSFNSAKIDGFAAFYDTGTDVKTLRRSQPLISSSARFEGETDFNLATIGLEAQFTGVIFMHNVSFVGATIGANAVFQADPNKKHEGTLFHGNADFSRLNLSGDAQFQGTKFEGKANFNGADLKAGAFFRAETDPKIPGSVFQGGVDFTAAHFGGQAEFQGAKFFDNVSFATAKFDANAFFYSEKDPDSAMLFSGVANFANAHFAARADFEGASFKDNAFFDDVKIDRNVVFYTNSDTNVPTNFESGLYFREAEVGGSIDFTASIVKGEARFDNSHFGADADFSGVVFMQNASFAGATIGANAIFKADPDRELEGTVFHGDADFSRLQVNGPAAFQGTTFEQKAIFNTANLKSGVYFRAETDPKIQGCIFRGVVDFTAAHFGVNAEFQGAKFLDDVTFASAKFDGSAFFFGGRDPDSATVFSGTANFANAYVVTNADFEGASFKGDAIFNGARIDGPASFFGEPDSPTIFEASFDFGNTSVGGTANFSGTTFNGLATFDRSRCNALADFRNALFREGASFQEAVLHTVYFSTNGRVGDLSNSEAQFQANVDFRGCTYDRIYEQVNEKLNSHALTKHWQPYDRQPYTQLEKSYRAVGQDHLADQIYLERQTREREEKWQRGEYGGWLLNCLYGIVAHYGVRPYRLGVMSVVLIGIGTILFSQPGALEPKEPDPANPPPPRYSIRDAFGVSLRLFSPIDVIMGAQLVPSRTPIEMRIRFLKTPPFRIRPTTFATFFLQIAGWILVPLILVSLTGLLKAP